MLSYSLAVLMGKTLHPAEGGSHKYLLKVRRHYGCISHGKLDRISKLTWKLSAEFILQSVPLGTLHLQNKAAQVLLRNILYRGVYQAVRVTSERPINLLPLIFGVVHSLRIHC